MIASLQDNASASANHNVYSTDFTQRLWKGATQARSYALQIRTTNTVGWGGDVGTAYTCVFFSWGWTMEFLATD